ncbi:arylsulfatase [Niabella sp. 3A5MI-3]|nr:arylsulfatase [Niabella beijingensis]MBZ4189669.1 arylsulfatase [Niabella beijingensis]
MLLKKIALCCLLLVAGRQACTQQRAGTRPNIIYILTDDLGIGDVKYYNAKGRINTPHIDRIGQEGMVFNDVHSSSAVCTPSRYSIVTGRYAWRSRLAKGVLHGFDKPLIDSSRLTVARLLQQNGYTTACIGKWHLGLGWDIIKDGKTPQVNYSKPITGGPNALGFDYFYGIAASLDMPPYVFIENDHTISIPDTIKKWGREGPAAADFEAVNCLPELTKKAVTYIREKAQGQKPFFLYFTMPSPHTPVVPSDQFKGKSGVTEYGDYVMETDWAVGELLKAVDDGKISDNTMIVFTSDNGFAPYVLKTWNVEAEGHYPSMNYRGYKADIWEGGHRIPFLVKWPGSVKAGSSCNNTVCLSDFMATVAGILGKPLPDNAAEDSYNILPYLTGRSAGEIREATVHHSIDGNFAIRQGKWKLELCPGSGGWTAPRNAEAFKQGLPVTQLYDLSQDIREQHNVQAAYPEVEKKLMKLLQRYIDNGRSTPGTPQKNDTPVDLWKKVYTAR